MPGWCWGDPGGLNNDQAARQLKDVKGGSVNTAGWCSAIQRGASLCAVSFHSNKEIGKALPWHITPRCPCDSGGLSHGSPALTSPRHRCLTSGCSICERGSFCTTCCWSRGVKGPWEGQAPGNMDIAAELSFGTMGQVIPDDELRPCCICCWAVQSSLVQVHAGGPSALGLEGIVQGA